MSRCEPVVRVFLVSLVLVALVGGAAVSCGPPGPGAVSEPGPPDGGGRGAGIVCTRHGDCRSGHCHRLFVCETDRAVSCNRDDNDCAANGLPGSACVEERTGICIGD